jgi:alpha-ketoglutarate-dependent taurine dioxygenase
MSEILLRRPQFGVHPIAGRIGAEIAGVRLSRRLPAKVLNAIRDALLRYKVIFFRDQEHLDDAEREAFAQSFGDLVAHPTIPPRAGTNVTQSCSMPDRGRIPAGADSAPDLSCARGFDDKR